MLRRPRKATGGATSAGPSAWLVVGDDHRRQEGDDVVDRRSSLPARRTRAIGRDAELAEIRQRVLHGDRRLITLTGAGGAGKTTLALEAARSLEPGMPDGAWHVDLTVVRDPDMVALSWCATLGLVDQSASAVETLRDHLAARQILIVLDNCEHLLPALGASIDGLLDACPDLRIIATSRAPLRVRGESVYAVPPFALPPAGAREVDQLAGVPSIQLFAERAAAVDRSFALTDATAAAVASICRRVDGLPLAIELAAAQIAMFTPTEIDERLRTDGGLTLEDPSGTSRQGTMEATLDWSHQLLDPDARVLLRRLAVFAGGWTLDAAESVGTLGGRDSLSVVPALASLVDHSLVVRDDEGPRSRYRMLAPIAEFATRKLALSEDAGPSALAHATHYLATTRSPHANVGQCVPEDLARVATEQENCLAAMSFAEQAGSLPIRLGLLLNVLTLWRVRGHLHLGVRHMEAALDAVPPDSTPRAVLLGVLAEFHQVLGEFDVAEARATASEEIFTALGDPLGQRSAICERGLAAAGRGDTASAIAEYERARPLVDAHPSGIAEGYWHAGMGRFKLALGDLRGARSHLETARASFEREPTWFVSRVLAQLGGIARRSGDLDGAERMMADALESSRAYGATIEAIGCLEDTARLATDRNLPRRAAALLAAATGLRDATAATPSVGDRAELDAHIDAVRRALPSVDFEAAWSAGLGMSLADAVAFATATEIVPVSPAPPIVGRGAALTPREREIAGYVALGLTNREIAERLVIAPGTVKIHVERILGKLGRTSRVQIATWASHGPDGPAAVEPAAS